MQLCNVEPIAAFTPPPAPLTSWDTAQPIRLPRVENPAAPTTETRLILPAPDPEKQYEAEHAAKRAALQRLNAEIATRVIELFTDALSENEPVSRDSLTDLLLFTSQISFGRRPAIYLLDNGNFRAVWKNSQNEQAAFQFRGKGIVHCVFFLKRNTPQLPLNQETLIDVIPKVRARLIDFEHLLQG